MNLVSIEKFVESMNVDVYPITLMKFLLSKGKVLFYFQKAADKSFELRGGSSTINPNECEVCKSKNGILCREHTSIERVMTADRVLLDLDTNTYFYKNEIFRMVGNRLVIIYCPHTRLIKGDISTDRVKKIKPLTIENESLTKLPNYDNVSQFLSTELMNKNTKCWFNNQFSIVSIPKDRESSDFCLITNR